MEVGVEPVITAEWGTETDECHVLRRGRGGQACREASVGQGWRASTLELQSHNSCWLSPDSRPGRTALWASLSRNELQSYSCLPVIKLEGLQSYVLISSLVWVGPQWTVGYALCFTETLIFLMLQLIYSGPLMSWKRGIRQAWRKSPGAIMALHSWCDGRRVRTPPSLHNDLLFLFESLGTG